jgi:hypothetical protein
MRICTLLLSLTLCCVASSSFGQEVEEPPLAAGRIEMPPAPAPSLADPGAAQRAAELERWLDDWESWKTWAEEWGNRRERGWFTGFRDRREKPAPPQWLSDRCESGFDDSDLFSTGCLMLVEWSDYSASRARQASTAPVTQKEGAPNQTWWEHVHLDVLWPTMQWQSSVYGVVGTHIATTVKGRLQLFLAPGAMLLSVPTVNSTRAWKLATNYGMGWYLFDFPFPAQQRASLHVNLAKAWVLSDSTDMVTGRTVDFVGLSITFNQR